MVDIATVNFAILAIDQSSDFLRLIAGNTSVGRSPYHRPGYFHLPRTRYCTARTVPYGI